MKNCELVKSFGCSFIFGTELADDVHGGSPAMPSKLSWPALIASNLGHKYQCFARPGSGNLRILEQILLQANISTSAVFVIGWSFIDRYDYVNPLTEEWKTILPGSVMLTDHAGYYYKNLHAQYKDKLTNLLYIKTAVDVLTSKSIPFVMTCIDELIFDQEFHNNSAILDLQQYINPHLTRFDEKNFVDWSKQNGYKISTKNHPLEDAHRAAAEYILNTCSVLQGT